jgi:hypothetical protein
MLASVIGSALACKYQSPKQTSMHKSTEHSAHKQIASWTHMAKHISVEQVVFACVCIKSVLESNRTSGATFWLFIFP